MGVRWWLEQAWRHPVDGPAFVSAVRAARRLPWLAAGDWEQWLAPYRAPFDPPTSWPDPHQGHALITAVLLGDAGGVWGWWLAGVRPDDVWVTDPQRSDDHALKHQSVALVLESVWLPDGVLPHDLVEGCVGVITVLKAAGWLPKTHNGKHDLWERLAEQRPDAWAQVERGVTAWCLRQATSPLPPSSAPTPRL